jgi:hypothetical protein
VRRTGDPRYLYSEWVLAVALASMKVLPHFAICKIDTSGAARRQYGWINESRGKRETISRSVRGYCRKDRAHRGVWVDRRGESGRG